MNAITFVPPSTSPNATSTNYVGPTNGSLATSPVVPGQFFDRIIQIWLENTDFATASAAPEFKSLASRGILLDSYYGLTHPSEPNYVATVGGDFWGMASDNLFNIPSNIATIVDLLDTKSISWASYQENMPTDGFTGFSFSSANYLSPGSSRTRAFYVRKHNPLIIYDSVATVPSRAARIRNFNDFAADVNANAIPQWVFVTPNLVNDGHDTDVKFTSSWLKYWLEPLLANPNFNDGRTLILLTFDENETQTVNNQIFALLLGGSIPASLQGTTDSTFYTHYSALSTVQANWALGSLGRFDTNKTLANVYSPVAAAVGYTNQVVTGSSIPDLSQSGTTPGPLNPDPSLVTPYPAPDTSAVGAGGGPVFV
ncbi:phosphoesterase family-domain-containing protein [Multifurca ochricompacta]|uniref:Phosphoesterase family-domain-containing protein n=1 Tax=Multifurca ochricompacta TaxID=376703 RepID=A0AAD4QJT0_9AGAM|nr:phosphoesterase family-domain-containing protein [Multifurca ochricompacta]